MHSSINIILLLWSSFSQVIRAFSGVPPISRKPQQSSTIRSRLFGWEQRGDGWEWIEDDPGYASTSPSMVTTTMIAASATPQLPSGQYKPKQSLGQNYLKDPNTVAKIIRAFDTDAKQGGGDPNHNYEPQQRVNRIIELGPGAGALTDKLVETYGANVLHCIEIDDRSVEILSNKHPDLSIDHADVLQVDYPSLAEQYQQPLVIVGNLPYYITSQILFALADAAHVGAVRCATVTMQYEVAQRMVASPSTKEYGILSVVFQIYAQTRLHFKIPPTVFYPQPKVHSALVGLHFLTPAQLRQRLAGVRPVDLRRVVTATFQQRRKTIRNSLKKLCLEIHGDTRMQEILNSEPLPLPVMIQEAARAGDAFAGQQILPRDWASKRAEELTPAQFIELTRLIFGSTTSDNEESLGKKTWRKLKHGMN
jgi:ribosomal RNA small subunit methyltransferase A